MPEPTLADILLERRNPLLHPSMPTHPNQLGAGPDDLALWWSTPPGQDYAGAGKGSVQRLVSPSPPPERSVFPELNGGPRTGAMTERDDTPLWSFLFGLTPPGAAYNAGHNWIGPGIENRSPWQIGAGIGLAALPFGVAARNRVMFTPEMREVARRRYTEGATLDQVAHEVGVATPTLRRHFIEEGIAVRGREPRVNLPFDEIARLHASGVGYRELAERFGHSHEGLQRLMHRRGYRSPASHAQPRAEDILGRVEALRREGRSYGQIATDLGVTRNAVAGMVRDLRSRGVQVPAALLALVGASTVDELLQNY
jgi:transposase-like protein